MGLRAGVLNHEEKFYRRYTRRAQTEAARGKAPGQRPCLFEVEKGEEAAKAGGVKRKVVVDWYDPLSRGVSRNATQEPRSTRAKSRDLRSLGPAWSPTSTPWRNAPQCAPASRVLGLIRTQCQGYKRPLQHSRVPSHPSRSTSTQRALPRRPLLCGSQTGTEMIAGTCLINPSTARRAGQSRL